MVRMRLWIWTNFNSVSGTDFYENYCNVTKCLPSYLNVYLHSDVFSTVRHLLCVSGGWLVGAASNSLSSLLASAWVWLIEELVGDWRTERVLFLFSDCPVLALLTFSSSTEEQSSHPWWPLPSFPLLQLLKYLGVSSFPQIAWSWEWCDFCSH